ncbi:caspase family protein [Spirillospora sp. NPDC127506]
MGSRRALLIGAEAFGLSGVARDLELMESLLESKGFAIDQCSGPDATYDGIISALEELAAAVRADDAVVIYYSGHGGRALRPDWQARRSRGQSTHVRYLVPIDLDDSTDEDFRGVLASELSMRQRQLTARTRNVTTILDCCYAGAMSREPSFQPRYLPKAVPLRALMAREAALGGAEPAFSNPDAVRLVATEIDRVAWEGTGSDGMRCGLFTGALVSVLDELGDRTVSWRQVMFRVRQRLAYRAAEQRPAVEGPAARHLFSLTEGPARASFAVTWQDGRFVVEAGRLLGLHGGDKLVLTAPGTDEAPHDAVVSSFTGQDAVLTIHGTAPPEPLVATLTQSADRYPIHVAGAGPYALDVDRYVLASPWLMSVDSPTAAFATVRVTDQVQVETAGGLCVFSGGPESLPQLHAVVEQLVHGDRLRKLADDLEAREPLLEVHVQWLKEGAVETIPQGAALNCGDRLTVRVANLSRTRLYVWLFDVGVTGRVTLLTDDQPDGRPLAAAGSPGDVHTVGGPEGMELAWPTSVPPQGPRLESLIAIAADRSLDLSFLETAPAAPSTPTRDLLPAQRLPKGHFVTRFDFAMHPRPPHSGVAG